MPWISVWWEWQGRSWACSVVFGIGSHHNLERQFGIVPMDWKGLPNRNRPMVELNNSQDMSRFWFWDLCCCAALSGGRVDPDFSQGRGTSYWGLLLWYSEMRKHLAWTRFACLRQHDQILSDVKLKGKKWATFFESSFGTFLAQLVQLVLFLFWCDWDLSMGQCLVVLRRSRCLSAHGDATVSNGTSTRWLSGWIGPVEHEAGKVQHGDVMLGTVSCCGIFGVSLHRTLCLAV